MKIDYQYEILENIVEIVGIFYLAFGLMTNYYWSCQQLDTKPYEPVVVWESVASIMCVANFANIFIIIVQLWISRNITSKSKKSTTNQLFYILSVPLFFGTLICKFSEIIDKINNYQNNPFSLLMIMFEFLLCCGVMILIININFVKNNPIPFYQSQFRNFVLYISTIGMLNYFLYHLVILHLNTFIEIAGNVTNYIKYKDLSEKINNNGFRNKLQAVVILFYFVCVSYLLFLKTKNEINERKIYSDPHPIINDNNSNDNHTFSFRIPPISILFGVMCITVTLLAIIVVAVMAPLDKVKCKINVLFPVPIYLFSMFLLILQINEMQTWEKLENRNFSMDRIFIRIGVLGQILVAFSEIKYNIYKFDEQSGYVILQYISAITQIIIQTLTCGLALNRRWVRIDNLNSVWSSICPPVGLLSMNIAFLMFSVFVAYNKFCKFQTYTMALELMRLETLSFGETLSILHRLHSSLIFGKIAYLTYRQ